MKKSSALQIQPLVLTAMALAMHFSAVSWGEHDLVQYRSPYHRSPWGPIIGWLLPVWFLAAASTYKARDRAQKRWIVICALLASSLAAHLSAFDWAGYGAPRYRYYYNESAFWGPLMGWLLPIGCLGLVGQLATGLTVVRPVRREPEEQAAATPAAHLIDNGDGTYSDLKTGLMWEKKSDSGDIHDKRNRYTWSEGSNSPDGTVHTEFLAMLNMGGGFAGHADWRLPTKEELQGVVGQVPDACSDFYWSSTTNQDRPNSAWSVGFLNGDVRFSGKTYSYAVRAVRSRT